jgi:hypothetical protein
LVERELPKLEIAGSIPVARSGAQRADLMSRFSGEVLALQKRV